MLVTSNFISGQKLVVAQAGPIHEARGVQLVTAQHLLQEHDVRRLAAHGIA